MSSGFISEAEIAEQRRIRQEEWDRVRTADEPSDVPEEKYDPRSLFDRLQEQKNKRDIEYEEAHKLKNMIKGLDDDEVEFLDLVDQKKLEEERKKHFEEQKEMLDFKARVASLQEKTMDERLKQELKKPQSTSKSLSGSSGRSSQHRLLAGVVVKKSEKLQTGENKGTKRKLPESDDADSSEIKKQSTTPETNVAESEVEESDTNQNSRILQTGMKCIGILPGLGSYNDSSDSDCSSNSDPEPVRRVKYDLLGRKIIRVHSKI